MKEPQKRGLLGAISFTFAANWVALGFRFALSVLVFRFLGASARGDYSVVVAFSTIAGSAMQLGLPGNVPYLFQKRRYSKSELHVAAWILPVLLVGLSLAFGMMFQHTTEKVLHYVLGTEVKTMAWAMALTLLVPPIAVATAAAAATSKVSSLVVLNAGSAGLTLVLSALLGVFGVLTIKTLLAATVSSQALGLIITYVSDHREPRRRHPHWSRRKRYLALFRNGTSGSLNMIIQLVFKRMDILIVNRLIGSEAAGVYAISQHFQEVILSVPRSSLGLVIGHLSHLKPAQALARYNEIAWKYGLGFAALAIVGAPMAALATYWMVDVSEFNATGLSAAMLVSGCLQAYAIILQSIYFAFGDLRWITSSTTLSAIVFIGVSFIFVQHLGLIALPTGFGMSAVAAALMLWSGRRRCVGHGISART